VRCELVLAADNDAAASGFVGSDVLSAISYKEQSMRQSVCRCEKIQQVEGECLCRGCLSRSVNGDRCDASPDR
jgi:hypothetical protein